MFFLCLLAPASMLVKDEYIHECVQIDGTNPISGKSSTQTIQHTGQADYRMIPGSSASGESWVPMIQEMAQITAQCSDV